MTPRSAAPDDQVRRYVETHHIDVIPAAARHGKPWQQIFFWAGANINVFNIVLGGVFIEFGLTLWWAIIAIAVGALVGGLLIALHATQGPRLGVPQTIQSRGQFGFYGAAFMFPIVLLLNVGFIAAQLVIQAQSLQGVGGSLSIPEWVLILAVPAIIIGIFGYRWIHRVMQATTIVVGITMVILFIQGLTYKALPASQTTLHRPSAGLFLAGVALLVIDLLSFGPFVSDYTRYLPEDTNPRRLFWAIYAGNVLAAFGACSVGAYLTALLPKVTEEGGPVAAIGAVSGKWVLIIMALSLIGSDTFNGYTGTFQVLAFANMWRRFKSSSVLLRVVPFIIVMIVGVVIAVLGYKNFVANLSNLLNVLLAVFIPWSAVNLIDFFVIRHGNYNVASFFVPNSRYGNFAWRGLLAYAIGLVAELPFISQAYWIGWAVNPLGGADISWLVGFVVAGALYLWFAKAWPVRDTAPDLVGGVRSPAL
ncbi:MAG TPA: cytosine permease [Streptosporangiaceae bacterium]|jgi:NCS1 family nucleobase:cation symporter-1|nr:cytosine permease [Streptosporangiaceae bacterium]